MAYFLSPPVGREAVYDAVEPGRRIPVWIQLDHRQHKRVMDDLARILF
jgi:hypothetical protein